MTAYQFFLLLGAVFLAPRLGDRAGIVLAGLSVGTGLFQAAKVFL